MRSIDAEARAETFRGETDAADDAESLPCYAKGSPLGQHFRQSGSLGIAEVLHMGPCTWVDEGFCEQFLILVLAEGIKIA